MFADEIFIYNAYFIERLFYGCFILFWLSIKVEPGLLFWAICSLDNFFFVTLYIVFNEINLMQVRHLSVILYDQPWLNLTPRERRLFVTLMIGVQREVNLSTGIQDLTLEWYAQTVKGAYSMGLVLEEMVQK